MKKIAFLAITSIVLKTSLLAGSFAAFLYAPSADGKKLGGYQYKDTNYIKIKGGKIGEKSMDFGYYGDFAITANTVDNTGTSKVKYGYYIFNIGPTLTITKNIAVYGGVGIAYEQGQYMANGTQMVSKDTKTEMNLNAGAMFTYGKFGLVAGYDSASKAANFGVVVKY